MSENNEARKVGDSWIGHVMETVCAQCRWLPDDAKRTPWYQWLCRHPDMALPAWQNYVTGEFVADPPYQFCKKINHNGNCPIYEPGVNILQPKETE